MWPDGTGVRVLRHLRRRHDRVCEYLVRDYAAALEGPAVLIGVAVAAAVCMGLIAPFFLPYLRMQESTGFQRTLERPVFRELRRLADFVGLGAPLVGAIPVGAQRGLVSGHPCDHSRQLGRDDRPANGARADCDLRTRDVAVFYVGLAVFTFWLTFGPKAYLYTLLYYTVPVFSFLRAPSRAGIVVTLCLVVLAAPALVVLMRRRA